jgi:hypothetical protein
MDEYTDHEAYGLIRNDTMSLISKHNVSPADMILIQFSFREDWDRINAIITSHVKGMRRNFYYPFGGLL